MSADSWCADPRPADPWAANPPAAHWSAVDPWAADPAAADPSAAHPSLADPSATDPSATHPSTGVGTVAPPPAGAEEAASPRAAILVLPPRAAERIAAGEVVERPASVVKELVENALDAGARQVRVEIRGGGLRLVRVVDDGCGIPRDEIALAFERHATSKIRGVDDLERLATLGFRGEALPSIAAVAEVTMLTATDAGGLGYEALMRDGRVSALTARPRTPGTSVSVRYLFQTVPARLKFVANARGEVAAIGALLRRYALAHPGVRFTLLVEGRVALRTSG